MDQAVRDTAVNDLGSTHFIEAGAGTGKTTMLVARVVALVTSRQARMEEIAAITFTEAAAAELRDRLAQQFESLASDDPNDPVTAAISALDASAVTTLHGFARKILAEQPFAVGLPPLFEVADASSSRVSFDERWSRFVRHLLENPAHQDLVTRALSCGATWDQLRIVALQCEENWDRLTEAGNGGTAPPPIDVTRLADLLQQAVSLLGECADADDKLAVHLTLRTWPSLVSVREANGDIDQLQILAGLPKLSAGKAGDQGNWAKAADGSSRKSEVAALLEEAELERGRLLDHTVQWVLQTLYGHIVTFTLRAANERRVAGRLTFHDLLVWARELVRHHPTARAELHDRYTHILIDEFQDTDPIQAELAICLATAADSPVGEGVEWAELPVPAGRLFFVGDPKQSIYRFRRADIDVFMEVKERVVGHALQLTTNFRSRPQIVGWVNAVFGGLFGDGLPHKQPRYEPLDAHEDRGHDNPRGLAPVIVLGREPVEGNADTVREVQARDVVAAISAMHVEKWKVGRTAHPLRYSDVAVLVRTRTGLPILEDAFHAAGVPYRLESSSLVYESQEVRQLLAILRAIDDPTDALSVVAALRSPGFGCGDDDLFRHRAAGGGWDPRSAAGSAGPVADALEVLRAQHEQRWWHGVSALVSQVVADRHLMALALVDTRPRESWRRIRFLVDQARLFDESTGGDLRAFLRWVGHQQEDGARVTESILPETDDDAVRVSTVHAAKGLEFPVTILLGLQTAQNSQRPPLLFDSNGHELCVKKSLETPGYDSAWQSEREMALLEQRRLLYVAATRASDILIVSVHRDRTRKQSLAVEVVEQCATCPDLWSDGSDLCTTVAGATAREPIRVADPVGDDEPREQFAARRDRMLSRATIPGTIAATGVQRLQRQQREGTTTGLGDLPEEELLERADASSVQRRGRAGTAVGRAVHAVLQLVDLQTGEGLDSLAQAQSASEGVPDRADEVRALAQSALDSALVRRAVSGGRYWRELYVGVPIGERVLEGFIDLLFESPEGLVVVDYKTDRVEQDAAAAVVDHYRLQGASYALAVQSALNKPVAGCSFLILKAAGALEVVLPDLESTMSEVEYLLGHPVS
jgi:ATP-dependent exoDNAse (exonuclease V) beta subunit